jgi:phosphopantetheine--protein transferase-like protein
MNKIRGIGIDIAHISRFKKIIADKHEQNFMKKVLHKLEIDEYNKKQCIDLKANFIASRWSVKEALVKATGNKQIIFSYVYLEKENSGKYFTIF